MRAKTPALCSAVSSPPPVRRRSRNSKPRPVTAASKEAEELLERIQKDPNPPKSLADRLLGTFPRPRAISEAKPQPVGEDLTGGFQKSAPKPATGADR